MMTGKLVRWNDEKGFGFIQMEASKKDVFIHISALAHMSRRPVVGDVIFFQIETDNTGKSKAIKAKIEGVPRLEKPLESWSLVPVDNQVNTKQSKKQFHKPYAQTHPRMSYGRERPGFLSKITPLVILFGALSAYDTFSKKQDNSSNLAQSTHENPKTQFQCTGKTHCSEMSSCEEATFYISHCPGTEMDGDHDGIPCERQLCN